MARPVRAQTHRARALRRFATPAERFLWSLLRDRRLFGAKFRRQHPIGPYFADFFCKEAGLVIEADGAPHFRAPTRDAIRDGQLRSMGLTVLRFENREFLLEPDRVINRIHACLTALLPSPGTGEGLGVRESPRK
ncbi:endonuclease domain-containing protein [Polyangium jinanense]|uniref:DUF559 domain-containing protein n=1 Tax=Polyangium jinanense TaxID=2829994 RepID=A0A9X3XIT2_9BACT|nr:DUF559 domain-containing protein [Polyangium jinanense]MDC3988861.1 DUF559 domain-containing protein [Polyangium jinanense]